MPDRSPRGTNGAGRGLLLIAAREPEPGMTKTRLGATIGMERAAALYTAFLRDLAARFAPPSDGDLGFDVGWAFTPADIDFPRVLAGLGCCPPPPGTHFVPQHGEGWDVRQDNLLRWGWERGYGRTVLIASDSPQLSLSVVRLAFAALRTRDVAMARSLDGGYSQIGMRGRHDILTGVPMSTTSAADALAGRAAALGLRLADLPETFDIDEEADLQHLHAALAPDGAAAPETWAAMHRLGLIASMDRVGAAIS